MSLAEAADVVHFPADHQPILSPRGSLLGVGLDFVPGEEPRGRRGRPMRDQFHAGLLLRSHPVLRRHLLSSLPPAPPSATQPCRFSRGGKGGTLGPASSTCDWLVAPSDMPPEPVYWLAANKPGGGFVAERKTFALGAVCKSWGVRGRAFLLVAALERVPLRALRRRQRTPAAEGPALGSLCQAKPGSSPACPWR